MSTFTIAAAVMGLALFVILYLITHWNAYVVWLAAWGVTTFILYGFDKYQARHDGLRVPEIVLHGLALIGGFLGGWAGMFLFWHKVRHWDFWAVLIVSTLIHAGIFLFLR